MHGQYQSTTKEGQNQEGYIEELSTCFHLDTVLLKSYESVLSEILIFNLKINDTHFKFNKTSFCILKQKIFSDPLHILLGQNPVSSCPT